MTKANCKIKDLPGVGDVFTIIRGFHPWTPDGRIGPMQINDLIICVDIKKLTIEYATITFLSHDGPFDTTCYKKPDGWIEGWSTYLQKVE
jgi:hypothetical protein